MPMLEIVVPIYNVQMFLTACLKSLQRQTFTDWRAFLIDDGSTDHSGEICREFAAEDTRFVYVYQNNKGVSAARNRGLDMVSAPWLSFIDPDDKLAPDFYELLFKRQEETGADVVQSTIYEIDENGQLTKQEKALDKIKKTFPGLLIGRPGDTRINAVSKREILEAICTNMFCCNAWGKIYRRSLWGDNRFPEYLTLGEDVACIYGIVAQADTAATEAQAIYFYRNRSTSLLHSNINAERLAQNLAASNRMVDQLLKVAPDTKQDILKIKYQNDFCGFSEFLKQNNKGGSESRLRIIQRALDINGSSVSEYLKGIR